MSIEELERKLHSILCDIEEVLQQSGDLLPHAVTVTRISNKGIELGLKMGHQIREMPNARS